LTANIPANRPCRHEDECHQMGAAASLAVANPALWETGTCGGWRWAPAAARAAPAGNAAWDLHSLGNTQALAIGEPLTSSL
jgi:hypothetical protein